MKTEKRCPRCENILPVSDFRQVKTRPDGLSGYCKSCLNEIQKIHHARNPQKRRSYSHDYYHQNPERGRAIVSKNRKDLRMAALMHYSEGNPACACCGEQHIEFLAIDHIEDNGSAHRKALNNGKNKGGSILILRWLRENEYPEGFQVLCFNCNYAKHVYKICPHQLK